MPGRLTAIAIIGYTSLRLMSAQFDCGVSLLSTLHSSWDFTSCFAVTFSLPVATVTVFRALYRQNFLIWEFRSSFFTVFVLCSYGACRGRSPLVCRTPAFLFAGICPFLVCRAQTHARAERGERGVDRFCCHNRFCS